MKTWVVTAKQWGSRDITADEVEIKDGCLLFWVDVEGRVQLFFALSPDHWDTLRLKEEKPS